MYFRSLKIQSFTIRWKIFSHHPPQQDPLSGHFDHRVLFDLVLSKQETVTDIVASALITLCDFYQDAVEDLAMEVAVVNVERLLLQFPVILWRGQHLEQVDLVSRGLLTFKTFGLVC